TAPVAGNGSVDRSATQSASTLPPIPPTVLPAPPAPDTPVLRVNGQPVLAREIQGLLWDWRGSEVMEDVITWRMLLDEANKRKIALSPEVVERELEAQIARARGQYPPGTNVEAQLRLEGFPKSRLYIRIHTQMLLDLIVMGEFDPAQFVDVSTIIFAPKSEQASDLAAAIERAQKAYDELKRGASWDAVLRKSVQDPAALQTNGRLGWRERSAFPASVREELLRIGPGDITKPAQTANGIQIFRLEQRGTEARGAALEELRTIFRSAGRQSVLDRLRRETTVERLR
ncbi:MAG: peptidylprolyl isomerase, partial [Fimbriimonadaceae bacterium]